MERNSLILLILGAGITLFLLFIDIYAAGIAFVIFITLMISLQIMHNSTSLPDITATLSDDAKSVILKNTGNSTAQNIHTALVPLNTEFDLKSLGVEESYTFPLASMIEELKVAVTFENDERKTFTRSYKLSVFGEEFEPLKPVIPLFGWK
jgi:hypothetical protein